jgi:hypothetical protein
MKNFVMCKLLIIFSGILVFSNFNRSKDEIQYFIKFKTYSDSIKTKSDFDEVVLFGKKFKNISLEHSDSYIQIRNYTYSFELNENPLIGFQRSKKIYDILERECLIPRSKIHYLDLPARDLALNFVETNDSLLKKRSVGIKLELH